MAANLYPSIVLYSFFLIILIIIISSIPQSSCQSDSPQNLEAIFPFPLTPPAPPSIPPSPTPRPTSQASPQLQPLPLPVTPTRSPSTSKKTVGAAVGITAASTLILSGLFFFLIHRYSRRERDKTSPNPFAASPNPYAASPVVPQNEFVRFNRNLKGVIVDEDGLDVIYWRNLEGENGDKGFEKQPYKKLEEKIEEKKVISTEDHKKYEPPSPEIPLLRGKSSSSQSPVWNDTADANRSTASKPHGGVSFKAVGKQDSSIQLGLRSQPLLSAPAAAPPPPPPPQPAAAPPPPPPPQPAAAAAALSLAAAAVPKGKGPLLPPTPPIPPTKGPAPPPPPLPKASSLGSTSKPPPVPKGLASDSKSKQSSRGEGDGQVKLKPLHWDKVNPNVEHSMVWDKIEGGSFK